MKEEQPGSSHCDSSREESEFVVASTSNSHDKQEQTVTEMIEDINLITHTLTEHDSTWLQDKVILDIDFDLQIRSEKNNSKILKNFTKKMTKASHKSAD